MTGWFSLVLVGSFAILLLSICALGDWIEAPRKVLAYFCLGLGLLGLPTGLAGLGSHLVVRQSNIHWGWFSLSALFFLLFAFFAAILPYFVVEQRRSLPLKQRCNLSPDYVILAVLALLTLGSYLGAVASAFTYQ